MDVSPQPPDKPLPPMPANHNKKENKLFTYIFKRPGTSCLFYFTLLFINFDLYF